MSELGGRNCAPSALPLRRRLGVDDPAHMLRPVQVVGELGDLGRPRVARMLTEQLVQFVACIEAGPDLVGQFGYPFPHVHASHVRTSRPDVMRPVVTPRMTRIINHRPILASHHDLLAIA